MERGELSALIQSTLGPERCVRVGGDLFLVDPVWGPSERRQFAQLVEPTRRSSQTGEEERRAGAEAVHRASPQAETESALSELRGRASGLGWLMIPTGGTSGKLKFARHDQRTVAAAVGGFVRHFGIDSVSSVGVLPLHHVSGFMAWMRTVFTGGAYLAWDWKRLEAGERPGRPASAPFWTISLVPTQLQRLLAAGPATEWLRQFDAVFIGGGPAWPALLDSAAEARLPLSLGYGMTETAAMATALRPAEFRAGRRSSGTALPHLKLDLTASGAVRIAGDSLFRGYFPDWDDARRFTTGDLANFDRDGHIHLQGRRDAVIITGGKKVDPAEVEAALRKDGLFADVAVLGVPDPEWGQRVTAFFPASQRMPDPFALERALCELAPFKRPRRYVPVVEWPRTAQGKINRTLLAEAARPAAHTAGETSRGP